MSSSFAFVQILRCPKPFRLLWRFESDSAFARRVSLIPTVNHRRCVRLGT